LSDESDGLLGEVDINNGHVEIIDEVDQGFSNGGTEQNTSSFFDLTFNNILKSLRRSVIVEVTLGVENIGVINWVVTVSKVIIDNGSLTCSSNTDVKDTLLNILVHVNQEFLTFSFSSSNNNC